MSSRGSSGCLNGDRSTGRAERANPQRVHPSFSEIFLESRRVRRRLPGNSVVWHQPSFSTSDFVPWLRRLGIPRSPPCSVPGARRARGAVWSARMDDGDGDNRLRRRTTTTKRWEDSGAERQVLRRTTTTRRVVTRTVVVEEFGAHPTRFETASPSDSTALRRRNADIETAVAVTAGVAPPTVSDVPGTPYGARRSGDMGRISEEELEHQAGLLRSYWAERLKRRPHPRFEIRLKPMVIEFGLEGSKQLLDRVAAEVDPEAPAKDAVELLFALMSQARHEKKRGARGEGKT